MWTSFKTYNLSPQDAFETMNNQLFERYLRRKYANDLMNFRVINGSGGDGGIEAYGIFNNNIIRAIQSKWFRNPLEDSQILQIKKSITTAIGLRPNISEYIVCIPRDVNSLKIGKGKKPIKNSEEFKINTLIEEIKKNHPKLKLIWWFEKDIYNEILKPENEGVHKFWFDNQIFFFDLLKEKFQLQKSNTWLRERYVPDLHLKGKIHSQIDKQLYNETFRKETLKSILQLDEHCKNFQFTAKDFISNSNNEDYLEKLQKIVSFVENVQVDLINLKNSLVKGLEIILINCKDSEIEEIYIVEDLLENLREVTPSNLQRKSYGELLLKLRYIDNDIIYQYLNIQESLSVINTSLISGKAGTGKTQGLAYAVEEHLSLNTPSMLIRAKGSNSKDWTNLLADYLELPNWNKNEIFSSLETLAIRNDIKKAQSLSPGSDANFENTRVLICIDGLEEDVLNINDWYDRISETVELSKKYPRVRFLFSARDYFYINSSIIENKSIEIIQLAREGDVQINDVFEKYIDHYKIDLSNPKLINGLDSLFALKLFCEEYQGKKISANQVIQTATPNLINLKLLRLNNEFLELLQERKAKSLNFVVETLMLISVLFYEKAEVNHDEIRSKIDSSLSKYLNGTEIELLIEFLSDNGILIKYERQEEHGILKRTIQLYSITYQSILEMIISDDISNKIINEQLNEIPEMLFQNLIEPIDASSRDYLRINGKHPNEQIIQNIINKVFLEKNKLIGENDFLTSGFDEDEIFSMQLEAILKSPKYLAEKYKSWILKLFYEDHFKRVKIFKNLIIPSAGISDSPFNAMFLHDNLINMANVFDRDKFWSGIDTYEEPTFSGYSKSELNRLSITSALNNRVKLNESELHNEMPLIYAWGLSTLNQSLRENLRIKLTSWSIISPLEFLKLLELIYSCNDPQIQEDLASITLGVASKCRDKKAILEISNWALVNIFEKAIVNRNVIVRYGFRAVVERAYQLGLISKKDVEKSRPKRNLEFNFLPLDLEYLKNPKEEFYPIVHDLAWYVIKYSYTDFLTYSYGFQQESLSKETEKFIVKYEKKHNGKFDIYPRSWAMAAAIAYIKSLGLYRENGNGFTDSSHGSKSKIFTFEEKYTWLAVNYLKGYLADYLPYNDHNDKLWIRDYSLITDIHNPSEDLSKGIEEEVDNFFKPYKWIIKEILAPELSNIGPIQDEIESIVDNELVLDFKKWIFFDKADFDFLPENKKGVAIYNFTDIYNSSKTIKSTININCNLITKTDLEKLKFYLNEQNNYYSKNDLNFYAFPKTDTYSNPSDIIWMKWIGEEQYKETFTDSGEFYFCLSKVTKRNVQGENEIYLPSKFVCKTLGIIELDFDKLLDANNKTIGVLKTKSDGTHYEHQELIVLDDNEFSSRFKKKGLTRFWFAMTIINKNPLNKEIEKIEHFQKVRKYIIWQEADELKWFKFWDGRFSNQL